jgi:hypothetical protein
MPSGGESIHETRNSTLRIACRKQDQDGKRHGAAIKAPFGWF